MNRLEKCAADNIIFLKKEYPALYAQIRGFELKKTSITAAKNGLPNLIIENKEKTEPMYSNYNPILEAERWLRTVEDELEQNEHILLFGLGLGYHLALLIEHYPQKKYYVLEPDVEIFRAFAESRPMKGLLDHSGIAAVAIGSSAGVNYGLLKAISENVKEGFAALVTPFYSKTYSHEFSQLKDHTKAYMLSYRANLATYNTFELKWVENILNNFPHTIVSEDISTLKNAYENVPAVIVGSGPSLAEDIETIRSLQDKCLIISAGTSIQALTKNNIQPDIVVSIDGGEPNFKAFKDIDLTHIPLLYSSIIHPRIMKKDIGKTVYLSMDIDTVSGYLRPELKKIKRFFSTGSVTGTAIQAAAYMGCNPVILAGQDLSYPNDQFYTDGVTHIEQDLLDKAVGSASELVPNVQGTQNKTTRKMINTLNDIANTIAICSGRDYINTSRYGAVIKGSRFVLMEDLEREEAHKWNKGSTIFNRIPVLNSQMTHKRLDEGYKSLSALEKELSRQIEMLNSLQSAIQKLDIEKMSTRELQNVSQQIQELWMKITKNEVFENILIPTVKLQMLVYSRQISDITSQKDVRKKAMLIQEHLGKLIEKLHDSAPLVLGWVIAAKEEIEEMQLMMKASGNLSRP